MRIKVRIIIPILPGELKGQIRRMSPHVAQIRAKSGTVEILEEAETPESNMPPLRVAALSRPRGRKTFTR